jgi:hypothetical protein
MLSDERHRQRPRLVDVAPPIGIVGQDFHAGNLARTGAEFKLGRDAKFRTVRNHSRLIGLLEPDYRSSRADPALTSRWQGRGVGSRRRFGRDIAIFNRDLRAPAGTLARRHHPASAYRLIHSGPDDVELRDAGRFCVGGGRQVCSRENHSEALGLRRHHDLQVFDANH